MVIGWEQLTPLINTFWREIKEVRGEEMSCCVKVNILKNMLFLDIFSLWWTTFKCLRVQALYNDLGGAPLGAHLFIIYLKTSWEKIF
jgi:hypothetical protein